MERAPSRRIRNVAHTLLRAMSTDADISWDVEHARLRAGPKVSVETCHRALTHLEELGAVIETKPGVWRRREPWSGTQADWYT